MPAPADATMNGGNRPGLSGTNFHNGQGFYAQRQQTYGSIIEYKWNGSYQSGDWYQVPAFDYRNHTENSTSWTGNANRVTMPLPGRLPDGVNISSFPGHNARNDGCGGCASLPGGGIPGFTNR